MNLSPPLPLFCCPFFDYRFITYLTLKRPGLCCWLRPTQFKPRLDWVGRAAQVRCYCVGSAAQAFIHGLAGCVPRSLQPALCGPRNSRSTRLMFSQPTSSLSSHNLVLIGGVKTVHSHFFVFFVFWHWYLAIKLKSSQYILHLLFS